MNGVIGKILMFIDVTLIRMSFWKEPESSFFNRKNGHVRPFAKGVFAICISVTSNFYYNDNYITKNEICEQKKTNMIKFILFNEIKHRW